MKKRTIAVLMSVVMLMGVTIGGTIAWLTSKSDPVTNTFTVGDINIILDEKDVDDSTEDKDRDLDNEYKMVPGVEYEKDPKVTVLANSEPCYVYVKVIENNNTFNVADATVTPIEYEIDTEYWKLVDDANKIYKYKEVIDTLTLGEKFQTESVLVNEKITINDELTKAMMAQFGQNKPVLTFKACAVQSAVISEADALTQAQALLNA